MVAIYVALLGLFLIGLTGLVADAAYVVMVERQMQDAADAAALAGAQLVTTDPAQARQLAIWAALNNKAAGKQVAVSDNPSNALGGDVVVGHFDTKTNTFTATLTNPNAVQVTVNRTAAAHGPVDLLFGPLFGRNNVEIVRSAIAINKSVRGYGIIALDPHSPSSFTFNGNIDVSVKNAGIFVNSDSLTAVTGKGNSADLTTDSLNITGGADFKTGVLHGDLNTGVDPVPDPVKAAGVLPPSYDTSHPLTAPSNGGTLQPGYYPAGLDVKKANYTLNPGVYVLGGTGLSMGGQGSLVANGVMFYFPPGSAGVNIDLKGGASLTLTPPTGGMYSGISIFQDALNTNPANLGGNSAMTLDGTLYLPGATLSLGGTSDITCNQLIANKINVSGNPSIVVDYTGNFSLPSRSTYLVK